MTTISILTGLSLFTLTACAWKSIERPEPADKAKIQEYRLKTVGAGEYLTIWTPRKTQLDVVRINLPRIERLFHDGNGHALTDYKIEGGTIRLNINAKQRMRLYLNQFYFPTWVCYDLLSGKKLPIQVTSDGLISIILDNRSYKLIFKHELSHKQKASVLISLSTAIVVLGMLLRTWNSANKTQQIDHA